VIAATIDGSVILASFVAIAADFGVIALWARGSRTDRATLVWWPIALVCFAYGGGGLYSVLT
jgi:hypothetical protein